VKFALSLALLIMIAGLWIGVTLAATVASPTLTSLRVAEYQDFLVARAEPLAEGSVPADTITFVCNPDEWREVMGDVPPPAWPNDPMMLLIGPLNHEFSCANIELRPKSDSNNVTLRRSSASAPSAPGGCAISVQRTVRGEPIVVMGGWYWEHQMATIRTCGERIVVPHTDEAGFLRVEATATNARTSKRLELTSAKVVLTGQPIRERQALIGGDGAAVLQDIPAWTSYGVDVQPAGCGVFHFASQTVMPGRITTLQLDLGPLNSLDVLVTQEQGGRKVPLRDASVAAYWAGQSALIVGARTDAQGHAVLDCIRPGAKIDVRVTSPGYFWKDACAVEVEPGQQSPFQVLLKPNPDPRRIPIPSVCSESTNRR